MTLNRGTLVLVDLDPTLSHEQRRTRPCVIVSDSAVVQSQRFPLVCIVPITGTSDEGILYPPLAPGSGGLAKASFALIDQLRSILKRRIRSVFGALRPQEQRQIDDGLISFLGLAHQP